MIRFLVALLAAASLAMPAAAEERRHPVTDFDRVVVEGPYVVRLVTGRPSSAVASGTRDALDRVAIDVQGQTLRIRRNRNAWTGASGAPSGPVTVELSTRIVRGARLIGPARLEVDGASGLRVEFVLEGGGSLIARGVEADNLTIGLVGSGRIEISGTAETLTAQLQGNGDLLGGDLVADNLTLTTSTSGAVTLGAGRAATINANGLGPVAIIGRPACTVRGPGAGQVLCSDQRQR